MTDRRYGVNKYSDGKLYGASDPRQALAWDVSIDWDEDGVYDGNEGSRMTHAKTTRGRTELLQPSGGGFQDIPTGTAVVTLRNEDGRFDAWNDSSALFPNVDSGKDIRIRVRDLNDTVDPYPLFRGTITNVVPVGYGDDAKVMIYASDGLDLLRNYVGRVAMQQGITPDQAIAMILDAVNWPSKFGRSMDASSETIPYWWASGDKQAMSEIQDLAVSFLGYFFVDARGQAKFTARSSVTDAVVNYPQEYLLKDIDNPQPFNIRRNVTRLKVHPRTQAVTGVLYQLVGSPPPSVLTGAVNALTLFPHYTYNNSDVPAINVIAPVPTTDWLINSQANGLGTNLTGSCTVSLTDFGDSAKLVITNNSGSTGYITFLRVRGDAIHEPNVTDITYPSDLGTVKLPRELLLDLRWQQDINVAIDISNVIGPFYAGLHPMPKVKIDDRPSLQYPVDLFDIVSANLDYLGLSGESFRVGFIEHETDSQFENCQKVQTRVSLEPYVSADDFMQWDTASLWDTETVFGY